MKNIGLLDIIQNTTRMYQGDLEYYFTILFQSPNAVLPYHNFRHMCHVTYQTYRGICYHTMDTIKARKLLIAAMFHDYGHTGSSQNGDAINIEQAIAGVEQHILDEDRQYLQDIVQLIQTTQHPRATKPVSLSEQILHDADLSQAFDTVWIQQIVFGLSQEIGISPIEMFFKQKDFIQNVVFYSTWGQETFYPQKQQRIAELEAYELIFKKYTPHT
jgi:hypothetical protein